MRPAAAAALLALALVTGAQGSTGTVAATVVAIPLELSLAVAPASIAVGGSATATVEVSNLGAATLEPVEVTLRFDGAGIRAAGGAVKTTGAVPGGGSAELTWPLCGRVPGAYVLLAEADFAGFELESQAVVLSVAPAAAHCALAVSGVVPPGGPLTTDEGGGATALDPVVTTVTVPAGGPVTIDQQPALQEVAPGLAAVPWQVDVSAPDQNASDPLVLAFELHSSVLPAGDLQLFRDGRALEPCAGPGASPDPCLADRFLQEDGDLVLVARSSAASRWTFRTVYPFDGFRPPVANPPTVNRANAGSAVPVKFALGGDRGLGILAAGYPASRRIACDSSAPLETVTETASAGASSLSYADGQYTYVWKTDKAWAGTCRELVVRLVDGTEHRARFSLR